MNEHNPINIRLSLGESSRPTDREARKFKPRQGLLGPKDYVLMAAVFLVLILAAIGGWTVVSWLL